ncbi:aminopeptidase P family protein [Plebeiibacterium marinum]|uniref:Xaa-Pro aminopeptidase n=1 Tax=Plebeiibacterium marinum TaxID=2992111 RepID=A0AAE3SKD3_9BACT|nr:aminopeptidase P family protein [Plebeiobacterium marinum]MCW3805375.1 aminopeptidase P family protein [Plebeiobacterium marinum]
MFKKEVYINRRKALKHKVGSGIILLLGNNESPMNYEDNTYPFRQDSTFLYFVGLQVPSLITVFDVDEGKDILFGDDLTMDMIVWMGSQPVLSEYAAKSGIEEVRPLKDLVSYIEKAKGSGREIHFLPPYRHDHMWKLNELLGFSPAQLQQKFSVHLVQSVVALREIKSEEEIVEIEKAVDISVDMHVAAMQMARPGMTEAQIAAEIHKVALASGGDIAFPIIATKNGQTLHNHNHSNIINQGDMILVDAGAQTAMGYCGDLSSTFPVSQTFTEEQKEIYQISLNAHERAISLLQPGIPFADIHLEACRSIIEDMKAIGLMKGDTEEALIMGAHALFFPCGLGHMMGLDVHDMENFGEKWVGYNGEEKSTQFGLKSLRLAKKLQPGHVLTIEPGIYFIPELIDMWKAENKYSDFLNYEQIVKFKNFGGIRNEEDFLITPQGARLLGKLCPKTISEVEQKRKG